MREQIISKKRIVNIFQEIWKLKYFILIVLILYIGSFTAGYLNKQDIQREVFQISNTEVLRQRNIELVQERIIEKTYLQKVYALFIHNISVVLTTFALGFLIVPAILTFYSNGYRLGNTINNLVNFQGFLSLFGHGIFEYLAFSIALVFGVRLGWRFVKDTINEVYSMIKTKSFKSDIVFLDDDTIDTIYLFIFILVPTISIGALIEGARFG